jgi:hypothetical protein
MQVAKWEYLVTILREATLVEKQGTLNELGQLGWELVGVTDTVREWHGRVSEPEESGKDHPLRLEAAQRPVMAYLKRKLGR